MREIIISTETGSDFPSEMAARYGIRIVPMHVIMDDTDYPDGSFPVEKIYDYYDQTKKIPSTSATNIDEYIQFFTKIREEQPDCVIMHFAYSSNASCTYQNAQVAMQDFSDIYLIDTTKVTAGCIVHILASYDIIEREKATVTDYQALADRLQALTPKVACSFIPGNLEYLKAGGRVSNAEYLAATLLKIKPLIEINTEGYLVATKRYRGAMTKIVKDYVREFVSTHNPGKKRIYIMYSPGTNQEILDAMQETIMSLGFGECIPIRTGCVISCHCGPGGVGLAGISD